MPRPKTPARLKKLRGNPGKRKIDEREPDFDVSIPEAPQWCNKNADALEIWQRVTKFMSDYSLISSIDFAVVEDFIYSSWQLNIHRELLGRHGAISKSQRGSEVLNARARWIVLMMKTRDTAVLRLGFSPTLRAKLVTLADGDEVSESGSDWLDLALKRKREKQSLSRSV